MQINTLTLNPAIDRTVYVDTFAVDALNRAGSSVTMAGGKGINVSRMLGRLGEKPHTLTFAGGRYGQMFRGLLEDEGIVCDCIETAAETRLNVKIIENGGRCTELNGSGGPVTASEMEAMLVKIEALSGKKDAVVENSAELSSVSTGFPQVWIISGSIPQGVDKAVYNFIISLLKSRGAYVALDCDGEALKKGVFAVPALIKPNAVELSNYLGKPVENVEQAVEAARCVYVEKGVEVVCTLGKNGAVYAGKSGIYTVDCPQVQVKGFAGAGDTFLAGYIYGITKGWAVEKSLSFASAAAAAKVELPCTAVPDMAAINKYIDRKVNKI